MRRGFQCAKVIASVRNFVERFTEEHTLSCVARTDSAGASESSRQGGQGNGARDFPRPHLVVA